MIDTRRLESFYPFCGWKKLTHIFLKYLIWYFILQFYWKFIRPSQILELKKIELKNILYSRFSPHSLNTIICCFLTKKIYLFVFVPTIWLVNEPTSLYINSLLRIDKNVCTTITFKKGDRWMYRWRCENWKWGKNNVKLFYWNIYPPQCWRQCDASNFGSWQHFYLTLFFMSFSSPRHSKNFSVYAPIFVCIYTLYCIILLKYFAKNFLSHHHIQNGYKNIIQFFYSSIFLLVFGWHKTL